MQIFSQKDYLSWSKSRGWLEGKVTQYFSDSTLRMGDKNFWWDWPASLFWACRCLQMRCRQVPTPPQTLPRTPSQSSIPPLDCGGTVGGVASFLLPNSFTDRETFCKQVAAFWHSQVQQCPNHWSSSITKIPPTLSHIHVMSNHEGFRGTHYMWSHIHLHTTILVSVGQRDVHCEHWSEPICVLLSLACSQKVACQLAVLGRWWHWQIGKLFDSTETHFVGSRCSTRCNNM